MKQNVIMYKLHMYIEVIPSRHMFPRAVCIALLHFLHTPYILYAMYMYMDVFMRVCTCIPHICSTHMYMYPRQLRKIDRLGCAVLLCLVVCLTLLLLMSH